MAWTIDKTWTDPESGFVVERQTAPRTGKGAGNRRRVRLRIQHPRGGSITMSQRMFFDLSDHIVDVCDDLDDGV